MKISDITPKILFKVKLTEEPILAELSSMDDFASLIKYELLIPTNNDRDTANLKATHPLIIKGLGVRGEAHLKVGDTFTLSIR